MIRLKKLPAVLAAAAGLALIAALITFFCLHNDIRAFTKVVGQSDVVLLFEGLPHQLFERELLEEERRTKLVHELNGYPFYQEPLAMTGEDVQMLSEIIGDSRSYEPYLTLKACGGFHPDYAVEFHVGADRYRALICFGCHEIALFGPGIESQNDLDEAACKELRDLLSGYRKNRPAAKGQN